MEALLLTPYKEVLPLQLYESDPKFNYVFDRFIEWLRQCYLSRRLVYEALDKINQKAILIQIIDKNDERFLPKHIGGSFVSKRGIINIRFKDNSELIDRVIERNQLIDRTRALDSLAYGAMWNMFSILIFELINMRNLEGKPQEIFKRCTDCDTYARSMEEVEAQTAIDHHNISLEGIKQCNWNSIVDRFKNPAKDISKQEERGHTQFYRDEFNRFKNL